MKLSQNANDYASLACSGCSTVDGISDTTEFKITIGAMRNVGISNKQTYDAAIKHSNGTIIGSAFIKHLKEFGVKKVSDFVKKIRD